MSQLERECLDCTRVFPETVIALASSFCMVISS
jgi:hypothetical protein